MLLDSAIRIISVCLVEKLRRYFFSIFGGTRVAGDSFLNNLTCSIIVVGEERSIQIDIALPSILRRLRPIHRIIIPIFLQLQLSLDFLSGKLVLAFECLICDPEKCDHFRCPEELIVGNFVAEAFQVFDEADHLVRVLLVQRLARKSFTHQHRLISACRLVLFQSWHL